ncbi:MAG TPA: MBL fold metallo-hydrolase [Cyclobacteriaceae bacterium]|nr:MBL fold metallo-hydrolase [Cyclobacteriaceae bacterium]
MRKPLFFFLFLAIATCGYSQSARTQVVLLGTGTPNADPERFGPSVAIVVDNTPYMVDCGPGVVRRASAAFKKGVKGLNPVLLNKLFITHLHSDHTTGYPDFLLTPAVLERKGPLLLFGPNGTKNLNDHIHQAYKPDYNVRIFGLERGDSLAYKTIVTEVSEGVIYEDSLVTVIAFKVPHGGWDEAFGYKFITPDKTIVISGDCTYSERLIEMSKGCDILIHEVFSEDGWSRRPPKWQTYHKNFHTSTTQLGAIANKVKPKKLILYHQLIWDSTEAKLIEEIAAHYKGVIVSGKDLDIFK